MRHAPVRDPSPIATAAGSDDGCAQPNVSELGFAGAQPAATGRPAYHAATVLKIYLYGYLNRIQSSRRLEREAQRNVELVWLTDGLMPDFKTIADFRKANGEAICRVCREFVELSRQMGLFTEGVVAIDGSKFKAINNRDKNFTPHKLQARMKQLEESTARYLDDLDRADREPATASSSASRSDITNTNPSEPGCGFTLQLIEGGPAHAAGIERMT